MFQIHLINEVLKWEKRLEIENERQKAIHPEPYRELPIDSDSVEMICEPTSVSIPRFGKKRQGGNPCCAQMHYREI